MPPLSKVFNRIITSKHSAILIAIIATLVYANTLNHQFTQDDAIVIYDNIYVQNGVRGLSNIFSKDSFSGFFEGEQKSNLVSGGRYRPLSIAFFALTYELFEASTFVYHLFNIAFYGLLCFLLYQIIFRLGKESKPHQIYAFAFISSLVFAIHPVHTEVVANVKGLDEIFSLMFALTSLWFAIKSISEKAQIYPLLMCITFGLSLLSKESAAPFLVLIPATLFIFLKDPPRKRIIYISLQLGFVFLAYLVLRHSIVGSNYSSTVQELMNNPFIKVVGSNYIEFSFSEKTASILFGLGKSIQLLFFPHPLTHDYYPRHIELFQLDSPEILLAIFLIGSLISIACIGLFKKAFSSFYIAYFFITIFLTSNILFPIGTHLSERFLFTPSVGFSLFIGHLFVNLLQSQKNNWVILILIVYTGLLSTKTITRNTVWKNDFTLFTTDVNTSPNSAKVRNAAGGAMISRASKFQNSEEKNQLLNEAILHLNEATAIHPKYKEAHFLKGNAYAHLNHYDSAILSYESALAINPYYDPAMQNLISVLRAAATYYGSQEGDLSRSLQYLNKAFQLNPEEFETLSLLGTAWGSSGNHEKAIQFFNLAIQQKPDVATTYVNLGIALANAGKPEEANVHFKKALELDPQALEGLNTK